MSQTSFHADLAACGRCGSPYRVPAWGREYLCPACGSPLNPVRTSYRIQLPPWLLPGALAVVIVGLIVWVVANRVNRAPSSPLPAVAQPEVVDLPADFGDRLRRKARLLSEDLSVEPRSVPTLIRLAETYLFLAVLERQQGGAGSEEWLRQALACLRKTRGTAAGAQLEFDISRWRRLTWTRQSSGTMATSSWGMAGGSGPNSPFRGRSIALAPAREIEPLPGPGMAGRDPGEMPRTLFPDSRGMGGSAASTPYGYGPPPGGPGYMPGASMDPRIPQRQGPGAGIREFFLEELRKGYRDHPDDVRQALPLGERLEAEAASLRPKKELARPYLEEAARVYTDAARRARQRSWQALLFSAAGNVYGHLGRPELQYQMLARAAERQPYIPRVWRELAAACLRTGRIRQSRVATREANEWTFPGLRGE